MNFLPQPVEEIDSEFATLIKSVVDKRYSYPKIVIKDTQVFKDFGNIRTEIAGDPTPGRNDPCICGSGKKFKKCCGLY